MRQIEIKIKATATGVLTDQTIFVSLINGLLQRFFLAHVLAADVDVTSVSTHREAGNQAPFDQRMRVMAHNLPVFTGAGLRLVRIDDEIMIPPIAFLGHERPFQSGRKARAATSTQAGILHLLNDPVAALIQNRFGAIPMAACLHAFQRAISHPVEVIEDPVVIGEKIEAHGTFLWSGIVLRQRQE